MEVAFPRSSPSQQLHCRGRPGPSFKSPSTSNPLKRKEMNLATNPDSTAGLILPLLLLILATQLLELALWRLLRRPVDLVEFPAIDRRLLPPPAS
jgi:hypothetical protein